MNISRGAGQNHRGAGRRFPTEQSSLTRRSFAIWLKHVIDSHGTLDARVLSRALADRQGERDSEPRTLVRSWLDGSRAISPHNAFRVGEALRVLGLPWCCGPIALYASRHYAPFLGCIHWLSQRDAELGPEFARGLLVYAQVLVEYDSHNGFAHAVRLAPQMKGFSPQTKMNLQLLADLPTLVECARTSVAHAVAVMGALLHESGTPRSPVEISRGSADWHYLEPALALLKSKAPRKSVGWHARSCSSIGFMS